MSSSYSRLSFGLGLSAALLSGCGGGGGTGGGGSGSAFSLVEVSNGFGTLLPYKIARLDTTTALPTSQILEVRSFDDLVANVTLSNPIRPPTEWPPQAVLPNNRPGNHFIYARFTQPIDPTVVLSRTASGRLAGGVEVRTVNPGTGEITPIRGRAFVGGRTYGPTADANGNLLLTPWVAADSADIGEELDVLVADGLGFPGTEPDSIFGGATDLLGTDTLVFIVDTDDDLRTHETFPTGLPIQMKIGPTVRSTRGRGISAVGTAVSTVGPDTIAPEVLVAGTDQDPVISPGNGEQDVDPQTNITIDFTEPVQVLKIGDLDDGTPPAVSASVLVNFGPSQARTTVPFSVRTPSVYDLTHLELVPVYDFPGTGPALPGVPCDNVFGTVTVVVNIGLFQDLSNRGPAGAGNVNTQGLNTSFVTREGPGIVNSPVTPDAVYIARGGSNQGISVIDLNGFGQGTGNPTYDPTEPIKQGNSNFPNNPNVALQGAQLIPPLSAGTCTFNGGSAGPFTLVRDSSLRDLVVSAPLLESVGDMAIGHALDNTFNNEQPFGCQSGGGNICAQAGLKQISIITGGPNTVISANITNTTVLKSDNGVENLASWAPHPNPPPLIFPPLCLSPLINGQEPTSILTTCVPTSLGGCQTSYGGAFTPPGGPQLRNLLVPGPFPLGNPDIGLPPQSTLTSELNSFFEGPSTPQANPGLCQPFMMRQQVGQFLYVVDRVASEIVVFNSNRFTVLDRIRLLDPTSLAMSPNLDFLAVTNEGADQVSFIDIDPSSATFHQVIKTTTVGSGPTGITWESSNEDIFVCNQGEGTVSVISGFSLDVRKTLRNQISRPIDVALTPRQTVFGFARGVYFGYILNQNGTVAVFESGPDGINGIGFDDVIATLPFRFSRPKTMQPDPTNLNSAVWIAHENPLDENGNDSGQGGGAISSVGITGGLPFPVPLDPGFFTSPQIRELQFSVISSFGAGNFGLSGIPVDLAFDNMRNLSALTNYGTNFSPGNLLNYNGKSLVRILGGAALQATSPQFMFVAVPNPGVVDVFDMTSGSLDRVDTNVFVSGIQSIPAPNAIGMMDYFRQ
jgi:hypothetical protein